MCLHRQLQDLWQTKEFLVPVLRDFNHDKMNVKLIIVCESPSDDEVNLTINGGSATRPANGKTERIIANAVSKFDEHGEGAIRDDLPRLG